MPKKLKIVIVEDELLIAEMLKEALLDLQYEVAAIARNYDSLFQILNQDSDINFIFLDINLSESLSGIDIAKKLNSSYNIPFIFLTSYSDSQTIQKAVQYKPEGYLIKPFSTSDLFVTLEIYQARNLNQEQYFTIKEGHFTVNIKHTDILWVKSENIYIEIKTEDKTYLVRKSLDKFLNKIEDNTFVRVHRSYVVNLLHVRAVNRLHLIVHNEKIPISRVHHENLVQRFSK